jgi:ATP-dependent helicase HrpB
MDLPVDAVLGDLRAALGTEGRAVLQAPPGAGKTTRVPLDLLAHGLSGRLLLLEPRRVAARAAATRLASQLSEPLGERVGLTTRDERRVSQATRIEVVTEGVLLRRLQADPQLPGVGLVFFDEFHERSLEADIGLALVEEVRHALREDLRVLVASATLDAGRVARLLGGAPVVTAEGRQYPVEIDHRPRPAPGQLATAVADAVREVVGTAAGTGDILVFLPGAAEIRRVAAELDAHPPSGEVLVLPLHGSLPPAEQDRALQPAPGGQRKVVLATDLAETSLTIEGVRTVVDAGLAREPRFDAARGMSGLVTVAASRASAEQRAGRAGRTAPGRCVRLWPASEHPTRDASARPAILTDDLAPAALELAAWGARLEELALLDQPPADAWRGAQETLTALGALDAQGRITEHGRRLAGLPLHPRLGHLLLEGAASGHGRLAAEVAALLADRDVLATTPTTACADMTVRVACLRGQSPPSGTSVRAGPMRRARREAGRLARHLSLGRGDATRADEGATTGDLDEVGRLLALGWPDRVAARRPGRRGAFLLAGGRGASLPDEDLLADEAWLAVAALDRGRSEARIHLAAPVTPEQIRTAAGRRMEVVEEVGWRDGDVAARREERLGAVVLDSRPLQEVEPQALLDALLEGLSREGLDLLSWRPEDRQLQARINLLHDHLGAEWPDVSDEALQRDAEEVLGPFLLGARRRADLAALDVGEVLRSRLAPGAERELERLAPTHLEVPSGSRVRLDYTEGEVPVLAVRIQEVLGAATHPTVLGGRLRLLVHLLSPARRPVQVTDDLPGFWERAYPQVRAELRGRYPKHAWPEDPWSATPTRGVRRRRSS